MYNKTAPQGNIMVKVCKCIGVSVSLCFFVKLELLQLEKNSHRNVLCPVCSLLSRTDTDIVHLSTLRESTGWTGLRRNTM